MDLESLDMLHAVDNYHLKVSGEEAGTEVPSIYVMESLISLVERGVMLMTPLFISNIFEANFKSNIY